MLEIVPFVLGPLKTNTYLVADPVSNEAAVIDPAWDGRLIAGEAGQRGWQIGQIWITHAHFDHIGAAAELARSLDGPPRIALHPDDRALWEARGGAEHFGLSLPASPAPALALAHGLSLRLGGIPFKVLHTPGHTPGHCIFYCAQASVCFCGDLIFKDSVGRTDLPGGDWASLVESIRSQVYTLPGDTRLLPGHGPGTTVAAEMNGNPFVRG